MAERRKGTRRTPKRREFQELQTQLTGLGVYTGTITGQLDAKTRKAVAAFQRAYNTELPERADLLPSEGTPDERTLRLINQAFRLMKFQSRSSRRQLRRWSQRISISEFAEKIRLSLGPEDMQKLRQAKIDSLESIREKGGYEFLRRLGLGGDDGTLKRLDAHANLVAISRDIETNDKIIAKGYPGPAAILRAGRQRFIVDLKDKVDELSAARVFAGAMAQAGLLSHWATGVRAEVANRYAHLSPQVRTDGEASDKLWTFLSSSISAMSAADSTCECRECEAAVSPLAYLADLLKYALAHLRKADGSTLSLVEFVGKFKQPFDDLPAKCAAMENRLSSMRIVVEILRKHYADVRATLPPGRISEFDKAQADYRFGAYRTILSKLGTSFEELRAARLADPESVERLMIRLGLPPSMSNDALNDFVLDPRAESSSAKAITESRLEELFDLADTTRDILSDGPTIASSSALQDQLRRWNLVTEWWCNTDPFGYIHVRLAAVGTGGSPYQVAFYRDRGWGAAYLVGSGRASVPSATIPVAEENASGLTGEVVMNHQGGGDLLLSAVPKFLGYRLIQLHNLWKSEDWPADSYADVTILVLPPGHAVAKTPDLPAIEPDLIGPDDFFVPLPGDDAYDLWVKRRIWVDTQMNQLQTTHRNNNLDLLFQAMSNPISYDGTTRSAWPAGYDPSTALPRFRDQLNQGEDPQGVAKSIRLTLSLTVDEFFRLMLVRDKGLAAEAASGASPTEEEWSDLYSILVMAIKRNFYLIWVNEEVNNPHFHFGPMDFVIAQTEPKVGSWPPKVPGPFVDPDLVGLADLPDSIAGWRAVELWHARTQQLRDFAAQLANNRETQGYQIVLESALSQTLATLQNTYTDLTSTDLNRVNTAKHFVEGTLQLLTDDFAFLIDVFERDATAMVDRIPDADDWQRVYQILTAHNKRTIQYANWLIAENDPNLILHYYTALKAKLPPWRASPHARAAWQEALRVRSSPPLIDPDQIDLGYVRDSDSPTNVAADLWESRDGLIRGRLGWLNPLIDQVDGGSTAPVDAWHQIILAMCYPPGAASSYAEIFRNIMRTDPSPDPVLVRRFELPIAEIERLYNNLVNGVNVDQTTKTIHGELLIPVNTFLRVMQLRKKIIDATATGVEKNQFRILMAEHWLVAGLLQLEDRRAAGHDIRPRLEQLRIQSGEFHNVVQVRRYLTEGLSILRGEWEELAAIAIQVYKRQRFERWRHEEQMGGLFLAPQIFRIPEEHGTGTPPAWRHTPRAHRAWRAKLLGRIEQQRTLIDEYQTAIDDAEADSLPVLRDALVRVTGLAAMELSARYAIDVASGSCQKTTRVGYAITTTQSIIASARAGKLTIQNLALDAPSFNEEWKWLGSYATWRASMFTFMYPENLLLPTLKPLRTPGFDQLIQELREARRLDRRGTCEIARRYSDYLYDVWPLLPIVSCEARTRFHAEGCGDESSEDTQERDLFYMFGIGRKTQRPYWAAYDPQGTAGQRQSFWTPIPGVASKITGIVTALPYEAPRRERYIVVVLRDENQALWITRYDLLGRKWFDDEPQELDLDLPEGATSASLTLGQSSGGPPGALISFRRLGHTQVFIGRLNDEATALEGDWIPLKAKPPFSNPAADGFTDAGGDRRFSAIHLLSSSRAVVFCKAYPFLNTGESWVQANTYRLTELGGEPAWVSEAENATTLQERHTYNASILLSDGSVPRFLVISWAGGNPILYYAAVRVNPPGAASNITIEKKDTFRQDLWGVVPLHRFWQGTSTVRIAYEHDGVTPRTYMHGTISLTGTSPVPLTEEFLATVPIYQQPVSSMPYVVADKLSQVVASEHRTLATWLRSFGEQDEGSLITYLEEADYFARIEIARQLQRDGNYESALDWYRTVYNDGMPENQRKLYFGFHGEPTESTFSRADSWFEDPLNPHAIAQTRAHAHLRFTLMSMVRCLLDFADSEFTRDNVETITHANALYRNALELLDVPEMRQQLGLCSALIGQLMVTLGEQVGQEFLPLLNSIESGLSHVASPATLHPLAEKIKGVFLRNRSLPVRRRVAEARALMAQSRGVTPPTLGAAIALDTQRQAQLSNVILRNPLLADLQTGLVANAVDRYALRARVAREALATAGYPEAAAVTALVVGRMRASTAGSDLTRARNAGANAHHDGAAGNGSGTEIQPLAFGAVPFYAPTPSFAFCIPPNPIPDALRLHAEANLYKIRTCRNIAGVERELEPYSAPTDTVSGLPAFGEGPSTGGTGRIAIAPTPYRYSVLIDRAKQFVHIAQQVESAFLAALEKRDAEAYNLLRARHDQRLSRAGVKLQDLRVREAEGQVKLAELQEEHASLQAETYQEWIDLGLNAYEQAMIDAYSTLAAAQLLIAFAEAATQMAQGAVTAASGGATGAGPAGALLSLVALATVGRYTASGVAIGAQTAAQINAILADFERRRREWEFQKALAKHDGRIAAQQTKIAKSHVRVVGQERNIAEMQSTFADEVVEFLGNKFTNVDLYEWMGSVLEDVYSHFLQQATSLAMLAQNQLAFERQEVPPAIIKSDYWEASAEGAFEGPEARDRHGLTGSTRLLQDVYQLDQYAFESDKRKHQLTKIISLAHLAPAEFQRLRETGVMRLSTPMVLFDQDFPGHYLRLIKQVRTTVVALIPPANGIRATLSASGLSRIVVGGMSFETILVRRAPESVALSSPHSASGVFELQAEPTKLLPFEGMGVDTTWELLLPKTTNQFDFETIADVLLTIDYTAFDSSDYRQQVLRELDSSIGGDLPFSVRQNFPDAWYHLHNPQSAEAPLQVRFETALRDFPPNIDELAIRDALVHISADDPSLLNSVTVALSYTEAGSAAHLGGGAVPIDGTISTARGNGGAWSPVRNKSPFGQWTITLPSSNVVRTMLKESKIKDILFVLTYSGRTPEWPQ